MNFMMNKLVEMRGRCRPSRVVAVDLSLGASILILSLAACGGSGGAGGDVAESVSVNDNQGPSLTVKGPTSASSYTSTSGSVSLSGSAADNVGVTQVSWVSDRGGSGSATLGGTAAATSWSVGAVALQTGANTVTVSARDAAGNTASSSLVVNYSASTTPTPGSTYYVDASAADDSGDGSTGRPKKYISSGAALMSSAGGSTLIVRAGTYGNAKDSIGSLTPGKAGAWNVIKAEVDGTVTITASMNIPLGDHYLQFEGLRWESQDQKTINGRYVKVLRSAFKGGPSSDNTMQLAIGTNDATPGAQYILVEDSYVYGAGGRYNVLVYNADKVVLRRVVVRHQDGWNDTKGDPQAAVSLYNSSNVLTQNLLIVDSGASGYFEAALYHPSNSHPSSNIQNKGAIILNTKGTGVGWDDSGTSSGNLLEDSVVWGTTNALTINGAAHAGTLNRVTVGKASAGGINDWRGGGKFSLKNSVLWQLSGTNLSSISHSSNDCYSPTCSGEASLNPATSGLTWLTRIELGSALSTAGLSGAGQTGATVLKQLGVSGTLWGDAGYDQVTTQGLWPWTNEAAIKKAMCTDMAVTTGFCAKASLTQYVWEYLGTAAPSTSAQ